ncbi:MAG: hypothetical protein H0T39_14990 [Actinobacteria bacterium]|nr:hypothetical protein [Actinomycetota bacterium]
MSSRVYTPLDDVVAEALDRAPRTQLVSASASRAQKLHALVVYANDRLRETEEREEKLTAYRELSEDTVRSAAIRDSVLAAAADGIL